MEETKGENSERLIRIDKALYSIDKYTLRIKPQPERNIFEGKVTIDVSIKDHDLAQINLHMQNLSVSKFQISFGETLYDGISNKDDSFVENTYKFKFIDE